ncbi:MAG TPA: hypothetical protein VHO43_18380 [Ignavibacteriales bacterium]|nr:hypothetical protein [Ignavibacteriales bacterium]
MRKFILVSVLAALSFSSQGFSQDDLEKFYNQIREKPQVQLSIMNGKVQVINIYKQQIMSLHNSQGKSREERISQFVKDIYFPFQDLWDGFSGEKGFKNWTERSWDNIINPESPGFLIPFQVDFDSVFTATATRLRQMTGREPAGKWYLIYGSKAANMGGAKKYRDVCRFFWHRE